MRNPNSRKHVSIDEYGSEEIPDVFGRGTQMQKSVAHTRIFSVLVHQNRVSNNKNVTYKCLMRNPDSRKHVLIDEYEVRKFRTYVVIEHKCKSWLLTPEFSLSALK